MRNGPKPPLIYGRSIGVATLTVAQLIIGFIHVFSGALLFAYEDFAHLPATAAYDNYTLVYGVLVLVFAVYFWRGKWIGWAGTIAVSLFVIVADSLTLLGLPSVPGIPKGTSRSRNNLQPNSCWLLAQKTVRQVNTVTLARDFSPLINSR